MPSLKKMQKRRKKLVKALKSGTYKQGQSYLRNGNKFCCLGVACDLAGVEWEETSYKTVKSADGYDTQHLPTKIKKYYGFSDTFGGNFSFAGSSTNLINLNDSGMSFKKIAKIIKSEPAGMFVK